MIFCFSMNLSLPAPPVRGKRQGLWGDNAASQALPIHHKSPGERMGNHGKSPLYGFTQSSSYSIKWWGWCAALTAVGSPASGPRSWETDLGPFQPLEPDSQECFLMCQLLISSDTAFSATEKGILCNWDFSCPSSMHYIPSLVMIGLIGESDYSIPTLFTVLTK